MKNPETSTVLWPLEFTMDGLMTDAYRIQWQPVDRYLRVKTRNGTVGANSSVEACSTHMTRTSLSYWRTSALIPEGFRMSALDEIGWLADGGRQPENGDRLGGLKGLLHDELFADLLRGREPLWEWTQGCVKAPLGSDSFRAERDSRGCRFYRADYYIGTELIAEGVLLPEGHGRKVVEWHEGLWLPSRTADEDGVEHIAHFHFDPANRELAVLLCRGSYADEDAPCLDIVALYGRGLNAGYCACRLFEASAAQASALAL